MYERRKKVRKMGGIGRVLRVGEGGSTDQRITDRIRTTVTVKRSKPGFPTGGARLWEA